VCLGKYSTTHMCYVNHVLRKQSCVALIVAFLAHHSPLQTFFLSIQALTIWLIDQAWKFLVCLDPMAEMHRAMVWPAKKRNGKVSFSFPGGGVRFFFGVPKIHVNGGLVRSCTAMQSNSAYSRRVQHVQTEEHGTRGWMMGASYVVVRASRFALTYWGERTASCPNSRPSRRRRGPSRRRPSLLHS
jgi:hypothetical protein